jgi:hypothetical protein
VPDVAELLGQDVAAARLAKLLELPDACVVRLAGATGSGKSHIAKLVATEWIKHDRGCVIAVGDEERSARELYPLVRGLSDEHPDWAQLAGVGARSTLQIADRALVGANIGTSIFDLLSAAFRQRLERVLKAYSSLERDVLLDLKRLARTRKVLIVADNAHWWDRDSLLLLRDVVSGPLRDAIAQFASIVVLLVDTASEQRVAAPDAFNAIARLAVGRTEHTSRCTLNQFPAVLNAFGLTVQFPDDVLRALFIATGGHLKLAEQVAAYAEQSSTATITNSIGDDYLSELLASRIESIGSVSPEVMKLLVRAAVLGLSFSERELLCISEAKRLTLRELIKRAEGIGFVEREGDRITFSHDIIRSVILGSGTPQQFDELYGKLSDCLAILRPGDYTARARAQAFGGESERSREMLALACVAQLRRGVPADRAMRLALVEVPDDRELNAYLTLIADGYSAVAAGDFAAPLPGLQTPVRGESKLMAAERNYLAALCSMELETRDGFSQALTILTAWVSSLEGEAELRLRFLMLLQQGQVLSNLFDEARETESRIEQELLERVGYDPDAAVALQIQNRRAAAVNSPAIAEERIGEAVKFFQDGSRQTSRDQLELFRSLNNLAATQIRLGKFAEAWSNVEQAQQIAVEFPDVVRRLDCLASNSVLTALRGDAIEVSDAIARQQIIIRSPEGADDKFLHRCNLAAFLLLAGRDAEAEAELQRLGEEFHGQDVAENYLYFFWRSLVVGLAVVSGDIQRALDLHEQMEDFSRSLKWPYAAHVRRRQELLPKALLSVSPGASRRKMDRILVDAYPSEVGPGWDYYARLFPCSELSYWSDS